VACRAWGPCWAQPPAAAVRALGPVALIGRLGADLGQALLVHAPLGLPDALGPLTRDRRGLRGALIVQPAPRGLKPLLTPVRGRQLGRQLVTAAIAEALVLGGVDRARVLEDLARQALVVNIRLAARVGRDLAAIDGDHLDRDQPGLRTQPQHPAEDLGQRVLVAFHKARDRRVIGLLVCRDHPIGDVLDARALDRPRGPHATRVGSR